ncbi:MAG: acyl-CoA dehydrogenase [Myxococcales bacterium]|nr:acyl-CoA dehydrogenase [Myxococcales bacterium]
MSTPALPLELDALIGWSDQLTEEEREVRATTRRWVDGHAQPHIVDDFEAGTFRRSHVKELAQLGLLGAPLPAEYGCAAVSNVAYGLACLELERCDSGLRSFVSVQTSLAMYAIWRFGSEEQRRRWLPKMATGDVVGCFGLTEPDHGSNPAGMAARCRRDGDGWVLGGTKMWITNAQIADVAVFWARESGGDGRILGFVVERGTAGFSAADIPHKLSMRASHTGSLHCDEVRVPEAARLPGAAGLVAPLACLENARYGVAFGVLGAGMDCFERARTYSRDRRQFGVPLAAKQLVQAKLADMAADLVEGSLLALHAGRLKDKGQLSSVQVSVLKRQNCRKALRIAREARGLLGANGIVVDYGVVRHMVNLESTYTYEGTDEVHTLAIGRALTGENAF